jgi:hypothetical protein
MNKSSNLRNSFLVVDDDFDRVCLRVLILPEQKFSCLSILKTARLPPPYDVVDGSD